MNLGTVFVLFSMWWGWLEEGTKMAKVFDKFKDETLCYNVNSDRLAKCFQNIFFWGKSVWFDRDMS